MRGADKLLKRWRGFAAKARPPPASLGIPDVKYTVAVASGKGGVGKSTTAGTKLTPMQWFTAGHNHYGCPTGTVTYPPYDT